MIALTLGWLDIQNLRGFGYACERVLPEFASESKWTTWRVAVGVESLDVGVLYQPVASDDVKLKRRKGTLVVDLRRSGADLTEGSAEDLLALARSEVGAVLEQIRARVHPQQRLDRAARTVPLRAAESVENGTVELVCWARED